MKITKKVLASLAITGMALTILPFNAFATGKWSSNLGNSGYFAILVGIIRIGKLQ